MLRRRRPLLRAAAVGGTAYYAGKHMERKQQEQYATDAYQNQQIQDMQDAQYQQQQAPQYQQPAAYQQAAPAPAPQQSSEDSYQQLKKLGEMHEQGILTDEEFAAAKKKILDAM